METLFPPTILHSPGKASLSPASGFSTGSVTSQTQAELFYDAETLLYPNAFWSQVFRNRLKALIS